MVFKVALTPSSIDETSMAPHASKQRTCQHERLTYLCSPHFGYTDFKPSSTPELQAAAQWRSTHACSAVEKINELELPNCHSWSFPAPLLLPDDALEIDPDDEPQSLHDWHDEEHRNPVTSARRTIYVCAPPSISEDVEQAHHIGRWTVPQLDNDKSSRAVEHPKLDAIVEYLTAFYHGLPVKLLDAGLKFTTWDAEKPKRSKAPKGSRKTAKEKLPINIGLSNRAECVRIRTRLVSDGPFEGQLRLDDLLDVAISTLPEDAYALLMLVDHDIYEDDDDDFCCGRAYGGSRVAVVSTARYNPNLDAVEALDRHHAWPASHCLKHVLDHCDAANCEHLEPPKKRAKHKKGVPKPTCDLLVYQPIESPLFSALNAHHAIVSTDKSTCELWLTRICKTASHELGHCFGIAHCEYYACIMQSTASLAEDARQPPYLCPVDQRKVLAATGSGLKEAYESMRAYCESRESSQMWAAFHAWLGTRLEELQNTPKVEDQIGNHSRPILLD